MACSNIQGVCLDLRSNCILHLLPNNAVEGWDAVSGLPALCDAVLATAPPAPVRTGPKPGQSLQNRCKEALQAVELTKKDKDLIGQMQSIRKDELSKETD